MINRIWKEEIDGKETWFYSVNGFTGKEQSEETAREKIGKFCSSCPAAGICIMKDPLLTDCSVKIKGYKYNK